MSRRSRERAMRRARIRDRREMLWNVAEIIADILFVMFLLLAMGIAGGIERGLI